MSGIIPLIDHGYMPPENKGGLRFGFFNANPFDKGIANLGYQVVADYLIQRGVNVYLAFADTISGSSFFLNSEVSPKECDLIAVSVPFEDTYLNVLRILEAAGLPIYARDRSSEMPLVIIGGMAMINPIPLSEFGDVFVIGEGREALYKIAQRLERKRGQPLDKSTFLEEIADVPGLYIPSHYQIHIDDSGYVDEFRAPGGHEIVSANVIPGLNTQPIYSIWTSRHACYEYDDYFSVMVSMGCYKKCPYCVVGHIQGDKAGCAVNIDIDRVVELAIRRRKDYGTNLIKLLFSSSFFPGVHDVNAEKIKVLLDVLLRLGFWARVGSLNIKQADEELLQLLKKHGQTNVAFAPETIESLRPLINKSYITDDDISYLVGLCSQLEMDVTLYTLGGLPGETDTHTIGLGQLIRLVRSSLRPNVCLHIHYNPVFMKAQTPYQWFATARPEEMRRKYALLRKTINDLTGIRFVTVIESSLAYYQPILASGDFGAGKVLAYLYSKPYCDEVDWQIALRSLGVSDERYFSQRDIGKQLPWQHIVYSDHEWLKRRFEYYSQLGRR